MRGPHHARRMSQTTWSGEGPVTTEAQDENELSALPPKIEQRCVRSRRERAEDGPVFGDEDEGGDAVCWLGALCPECGAMPSEGTDRCWRCGAERRSGEEQADQAT